MVTGAGNVAAPLTSQHALELARQAMQGMPLDGKRVLAIIPDGTRSGPVGLFFRILNQLLAEKVSALDFLIALGTHQPMSTEAICKRLDVTEQELSQNYAHNRIFNHHWDDPSTFKVIGEIAASEIEQLSKGMLSKPISVTVNKLLFDYDHIIIVGPVFPHEVVGFSGGNKYFFPGISGKEVIDMSHWMGALRTCQATIGTKHTPMRALIDRAASFIKMPKTCFCMVVKGEDLHGLYIGSPEDAWSAAADLSAKIHILTVPKPFKQVLSVMPEMYDDIWTGAKGMYKLEPVVADGGEVIIYAPHINEISYTHGHILDEVGYHVRDYFVKQWDRFKGYPWGVLAHSTHLRGAGTYEDGVENARIQVTLATGVPESRCRALCLGYRDPASITVAAWENREKEGVLVVPHAGEMLYRLE